MTEIQWELKSVPLKQLKPHSKNPRSISKDQAKHLEELIKKYGLIDKPIVNQDLTIIGGHQRIQLLKKMKHKEVQCWVPDHQLTQQEVDHLCIGLNLNQGQWDWDILANEWEPINLLEYGFTEEQLVGNCKESEEEITTATTEESDNKKQKKHTCPSCGHEFYE